MRTQNTVYNSITNTIAQLVNIILKFIVRTFFIQYIGIQYLGLNGLFANIISILSLSELGFGFAISTILYKPLAEKNYEKINTLVFLCKKIYTVIGIAIICLSVLVSPFLHLVIKNSTLPIGQVRIYFILYACFTAVSYFNYHKTTLLITDQKGYIEKKIFIITSIVSSIFYICIIVFFKSFLLYLIAQIIGTIVHNVWVAVVAQKNYSFLSAKYIKPLATEDKKQLKRNVLSLIWHKFGGVIVFSTDNLIMSALIGIDIVGIYSNYSLVISSASAIFVQIVSGATASIGNLWAKESEEKVFELFTNLRLFNFWLFSFLSITLFIMLEPFMIIWVGKDLLLSKTVVLLLCVNLYLSNSRQVVLSFKDTKGLYYYDRYKSLVEAIVNLVFSLLLVHYIGLSGIFIGTMISTVTICLWVEPYVLYKHGFKRKLFPFFKTYCFNFVLFIGIGALTAFICHFLSEGIGTFFIKLLICLIVPNTAYFLLFKRTKEFNFIRDKFFTVFQGKK